jgi:hypothetical protein
MSSSKSPVKSWTTPVKVDRAFVEDSDVLDDLIIASEDQFKASTSPLKTSPNRGVKTKVLGDKSIDNHRHKKEISESQQLGIGISRELFLSKVKQDDAITRYAVQKSIERKNEQFDEKFLTHLDNLDHGREFLETVSKDIHMFEESQKNKLKTQLKEWNEKVHAPIAMCIAKKINAISPKELNRIKCSDYQNFLNVVNKKPCIFRDIIIESEYDPLEVNKRSIVAKVPILNDPTHLDQMKIRRESAMLNETEPNSESKAKGKHKGMSSPFKTREVLPVELWETGKIESTPYGVAAKMMDPNAPPPVANPNQASHVHFNDFQFPRGKAAIDAEMPLGKRCIPQNPSQFTLNQNLPPPERKSTLKTMQARVTNVIFGPADQDRSPASPLASSALSSIK